MSESSPKKPTTGKSAPPAGSRDDRRARQAEQLRENLRRRKEQARARENAAKRERGGTDGSGG